MKRKVDGNKESGRLCRRKMLQRKSRRRLSLSEDDLKNDDWDESTDSQSSSSSLRSKRRSVHTDDLDGFIVDDEEDFYGDSSCCSPKSNKHDELLGYSLYCVMCDKWVHKDSFSAHQRRLGEYGDDCYCLLHTAGNHKHYVERLQMTAMRNNDGDDEAAEETDWERSRRQREAWKRQNWTFFDRPRLEEPEAKLVASDELSSLSRGDFFYRKSFGSDHLDNVIAKYSQLIDPDEDASPTKKLKSRKVDSREGRRRVSALKRHRNWVGDSDSDEPSCDSPDAADDDDEPPAPLQKRRKRIILDDDEDEAPLALAKKRTYVLEGDEDNDETPASTRKKRRHFIDHDDEENDPLNSGYQKHTRPVDDSAEILTSARAPDVPAVADNNEENDHERPNSIRKKHKRLNQNNGEEGNERHAPILRKRRRIIDDDEDQVESPPFAVKLKRRRIIVDDDDGEEPPAPVRKKGRRLINDGDDG